MQEVSDDRSSTPQRPSNIVVDLREAYTVLDSLVIPRLARHGHEAVRAAHSAVFEHLDAAGTTVSTLARRARMTKQAMAELVQGLERLGYLRRVPDPTDRRAKLVVLTEQGREVITIARGLVPEAEQHVADTIGPERLEALRHDLQAIRAATWHKYRQQLASGDPDDL